MSQPGPPPQPGPPAPPRLVVGVVFEPSHQARSCLAAAYARVVPSARRALRDAADRAAHPRVAPMRHAQGGR
jgi:hypothetical protein